MMAPFAVLFGVFVIYPLVKSLYLSFTNYRGIKPPVWIGLENYTSLFGDERFRKAMLNTFLYVAGSVTPDDHHGAHRGDGVPRAELAAPHGAGAVLPAVGHLGDRAQPDLEVDLLARGLRHGEPVRRPLRRRPGGVAVDAVARGAVLVFMGVWGGIGYGMVIFVAGLNAIPEEYYESARMDGATPWQQFTKITLPLLRPVTAYVVITGLIGAFQIFEAVFIIFFRSAGVIGGLHDSALMIVPYLYDQGFGHFYLGRASAIAWVLLVIIFVISMIHLRITRANRDLTQSAAAVEMPPSNRTKRGSLTRPSLGQRLATIPLYVLALSMLAPFYWMVISSFKSVPEITRSPPTWIPQDPTLNNFYDRVWNPDVQNPGHTAGLFQRFTQVSGGYWKFMFNSVLISTSITLGALLIASLAALVIAKHQLPGRRIIYLLIIGSMMLPWQVTLIPNYITVSDLGWLSTYQGYIIPALAKAFVVFFLVQYLQSLPDELFQAARVDGAGSGGSGGVSCCRCCDRRSPRWRSSWCSASGTTSSGRSSS
ncbi:ABC transporter permease subunit [Luedemannella flava]